VPNIPLAQAKEQLAELVDWVNSSHSRVTVIVGGRPAAVLLAHEDLQRLEETIAVLSDNDLMRQLAESEADVAAGRLHDANDLAEAMQQRRDHT
jgi:prevent-host-death family protein